MLLAGSLAEFLGYAGRLWASTFVIATAPYEP
jgi:hypothetical protein